MKFLVCKSNISTAIYTIVPVPLFRILYELQATLSKLSGIISIWYLKSNDSVQKTF